MRSPCFTKFQELFQLEKLWQVRSNFEIQKSYWDNGRLPWKKRRGYEKYLVGDE
jgi:hypothetical protein